MGLPAIIGAGLVKYGPMALSAMESLKGFMSKGGSGTPMYKENEWERNWLKYTENTARDGAYTPALQKEVLQGVSQSTGDIAEQQRAVALGQATGAGLEDSIARFAGLDNINREQMTQIATTARDLALKNAQSKFDAQQQLGDYGQRRAGIDLDDRLRQYGERRQLNQIGFEELGSQLKGIDGKDEFLKVLQGISGNTPSKVVDLIMDIARSKGWIE